MAKPAGENATNTNFDVEVRALFGGRISKLDIHQIRGDVSNSHGNEFHSDPMVAEILKATDYSSIASLRMLQEQSRPIIAQITNPTVDYEATAKYVHLLHAVKPMLPTFFQQLDPSLSDGEKLKSILEKKIELHPGQDTSIAELASSWIINYLRSELGIQYQIMSSGFDLSRRYLNDEYDRVDTTQFFLKGEKYWKRKRVLIAQTDVRSRFTSTDLASKISEMCTGSGITVNLCSAQPQGDKRSQVDQGFYDIAYFENDFKRLDEIGHDLSRESVFCFVALAGSDAGSLKNIVSRRRLPLYDAE